MIGKRAAGLMLALGCGLAHAAGLSADKRLVTFDALDMARIAAEDAANVAKQEKYRFAVGHDVKINPSAHGTWLANGDGSMTWTFDVETPDAAHLNFGFNPFRLPAGARLVISSPQGVSEKLVYTDADNAASGQLWTAVLQGANARLQLDVPAGKAGEVQLELVRIGHGYRGFGSQAKQCKSGACNMDVACLGPGDPWNEPRRAVGAYTTGGTDTCTGSLVNNTANDRRMLFATAAHCEITSDSVAATVVVYWNYESPTCRTPGSGASGQVVPRPTTTTSGGRFLATTVNPFGGGTTSALRSDFTLLELNGPPDPAWNLYWAGWDRRDLATHACAATSDPASTSGLCASIHHPGVDEKRITFVEADMDKVSYQGGIDSHWHPFWDPTPPILPGIQPPPTSVVPNVTEAGSSGSPLYNADHRLVGVLSGGPSACGATGASLSDYYGRLASAWEGGGTPTTSMKSYLDPVGSGTTDFIDGIGQCTQPAAPTNVAAASSGANRNTVTWTAVSGITKYRVLRTTGTCPGTGYVQIAEVDNATTYDDTTVSGGLVYSYQVTSVSAEPCESPRSACASATATGQCTLPPTFAGLASAASAGTAQCGVNLAWGSATGNCGASSAVKFNVFRSTTPGFTPSAANAVATCQAGSTYTDANVASGASYHYVVRAEDAGASGSGVCGGVEASNTVSRSTTVTGPAIFAFEDDAETGTANWTVAGTGGGADWSQVTDQSHSPTHAWFVPDPPSTSERVLTLAAPLAVPSIAGVALEAWLSYNTERNYDGMRLEYSLDGGTTWSDVTAGQGAVPANANRFLEGGYTGAMSAFGGFGAVPAWHGSRTAWTRAVVDLADFRGRSATFRFRFKSDSADAPSSGGGVWLDDVKLSYGSACTPGVDLLFKDGFDPAGR